MSPQTVDMTIAAGWVIPMAPDETVALVDHTVVIHAGKLLDLLPTSAAASLYAPTHHLDRRRSILLPGLINAHTHTGMTLMRGRADDQPLLKWLHETIWPIEGAFAGKEEFCEDGALLAAAEMLRGGVTCFADMYMFPAAAARVAMRTGLRAVIGLILIDFPSAYAADIPEYIQRGRDIRHHFRHHPRLHFAYAPHAPYTVPPHAWMRLKELSQRDGIPIHTHLHETRDECTASAALQRTNPACHRSDAKCHPLEDFRRRGLLSHNFLAAHMVHLTDAEIEVCAQEGVHIAHCPSSNAKLASGFCPVHKLLHKGVNVALGTDSACSNNSLDMLAEMKMAALNAKNVAGDATVVPASMAIRMATINGARALGISDVVGSLEVGKSADLVCIDVQTHAGNAPMFDPHSAVVYAASREDVNDVMVAGQMLLRNKQYLTLELGDVLRRAEHWRSRIAEKFPIR